jgi:hypothetical protein
MNRFCEVVFDAVNCEGVVKVDTADMGVICPTIQDDISATPIFNPEDDPLLRNFFRARILQEALYLYLQKL